MVNNKCCKAYPHPVLHLALNIILLVTTIGLWGMYSIDYTIALKKVILILAIFFTIFFIGVFLVTTFSSWNRPIIFATDKIYKKKHTKVYKWKWEDLLDIECHSNQILRFSTYFPKVELKFKSDEKITITTNRKWIDFFMELCPSSDIKKKLTDIMGNWFIRVQ